MLFLFIRFFLLLQSFGLTYSEPCPLRAFKLPLNPMSGFEEMMNSIKDKHSVLVCFIKSPQDGCAIIKAIEAAVKEVGKVAAVHVVDCSDEGQKVCRDLQLTPEPYVFKHYHNGKFHKNFDGIVGPEVLVKFLKNPNTDLAWDEIRSSVVHLSDMTFKATLKNTPHAMVMFYAPWCGHCQKTKPCFQSAADQTKNDDKILFGAVDCVKHSGFCGKHKITGYPTIRYYHFYNQQIKEYRGSRKTPEMVQFVNVMDEQYKRGWKPIKELKK